MDASGWPTAGFLTMFTHGRSAFDRGPDVRFYRDPCCRWSRAEPSRKDRCRSAADTPSRTSPFPTS